MAAKIKQLVLNDLDLKKLEGRFGVPGINIMSIINCKVREIDPSVFPPIEDSLKKLNLSKNSLEEIP